MWDPILWLKRYFYQPDIRGASSPFFVPWRWPFRSFAGVYYHIGYWNCSHSVTFSHSNSLSWFFFFYYYHFMGFIECSYLWLSFKWDTFGSHFSFFMIFALVFEARLYLFITLMARFWHSIQSRLPHPIILFKLCLKFSRWLLYLSLNPSKTGQKLFVFIQHLRVLNKLKT